MGGSRSGRTSRWPTIEATRSIRLRLRDLLAGFPGPGTAEGNATWDAYEGPFTITFRATLEASGYGKIELEHLTRREPPEPVAYQIRLACTHPFFGGRRWWFFCPSTGDRAAVLILPLGGTTFASRQGYRLGYASIRTDRSGRLHRSINKLNRKLGGEDAPKPKGMHWKTYERHITKLAEKEAELDWLFTRRVFDRWGPKY